MAVGKRRPTRAIINLDAIRYNYRQIKAHVPSNRLILPVVKANAYGHGAIEVAQALQEEQVAGFAVAIMDEAIELREHNIVDEKLLVLGIVSPEDALIAVKENISLTVADVEWLKEAKMLLELTPATNKLNIHLAIDTGMGRIGLREPDEIRSFLSFLKENQHLFNLEGVFTHFATADGEDDTKIIKQKEKFDETKEFISNQGYTPAFHLANSAITLWQTGFDSDIVRPGIALYGGNPSDLTLELTTDLKPALTFETEIIYIKQMHEGDTVSYGARYTCKEGEWIATLPVGYADGLHRRSTGLNLLIEGQAYPIVGAVCMDQTMISLDKAYPVGTKVTIIGRSGDLTNKVENMAVTLGTIGYELLCSISGRVPRIYETSEKE